MAVIGTTYFNGLVDQLAAEVKAFIDLIGDIDSPVSGEIQYDLDTMIDNYLNSCGEKVAINAMSTGFNGIQDRVEVMGLLKQKYGEAVRAFNAYLRSEYTSHSYYAVWNGFNIYCYENSVRMPSYFCLLVYLLGFTAYKDYCFHEIKEDLGTFTATGAGVGNWVPSSFDWDTTFPDTAANYFGCQPSGELECEVTVAGGIGIANVNVSAIVVNNDDAITGLTCTIPAGSPLGTIVQLGTGEYWKAVNQVTIALGTAADAFRVQFRPVRAVTLS